MKNEWIPESRWRVLEPLLDHALELPVEERPAFIRAATNGDDALRADLELMLSECAAPVASLDGELQSCFASLLDEEAPSLTAVPAVLAERFRIEREVRRGQAATVYLARDLRHDRDVAVKVLHPALAAVIGGERFLSEIRVTANLRHPHIVPLFESGEVDGRVYYVMPFVEGDTLCDRLEREGALAVADAVSLLRDIADAVAYAHAQGVVHLDIKPENILLGAGGPVLSDFGIARALSQTTPPAPQVGADPAQAAPSRMVAGTPGYMSPEQLSSAAPVDARSDVYSLGVVAYEMLAGERLFPISSLDSLRDSHLHETPVPLSRRCPGVPSELSTVIQRSLAKAPGDRFASAAEFRAALDAPLGEARGRASPYAKVFIAAAITGLLVAGSTAVVKLGTARADAIAGRRSAVPPARTIAVGFIQNQGGDSTAETARILTGLLATDLARVRGLSVVSDTRLYEMLGQLGVNELTRQSFVAAARRAGAVELIEGVLYQRPSGALRLDLRRVNASDGAIRESYTTDGADAFELVDRLTASIAETFALTPPSTPLAATASGTIVARRFYEEGLRTFYRGEWRGAYQLFSAAMAEDSTFAMAAYYAARSIEAFRTDSAFLLAVRAERLSARAPERDRLIIKYARYADYSVRAAVAESLTLRFPNEPDGPLAMATSRIFRGDFLGALPYARRVIVMDSLSLQGKTALCRACEAFGAVLSAYAAMGIDSFPAVERVAHEWIQRQPKSSSAWLMLAKALAQRGRNDEALQALNKVSQLPPGRAHLYEHPSTMPAVLFESAVIQNENYREAERQLRDRSRFDERDQEAIWWLVTSLRHQGRIQESFSLTRKARQIRATDGRTLAPWDYVEGTLLFELGRFRESALRFEALMRPRPNDPSDPGYTARYGVQAATAWAAAGDTQRLPALVDSIERAARHSAFGLDRHLPDHVRGLLWQARGQPARAVEEFQTAIYSPTLGYTRTNLELARALLLIGRPHQAIRILREALAGSSDGPDYFLTRTEVHDDLARAFEAAGQADSARVHYGKVAEAWKNGDAPYRARAEAARSKLRSLVTSSR